MTDMEQREAAHHKGKLPTSLSINGMEEEREWRWTLLLDRFVSSIRCIWQMKRETMILNLMI